MSVMVLLFGPTMMLLRWGIDIPARLLVPSLATAACMALVAAANQGFIQLRAQTVSEKKSSNQLRKSWQCSDEALADYALYIVYDAQNVAEKSSNRCRLELFRRDVI